MSTYAAIRYNSILPMVTTMENRYGVRVMVKYHNPQGTIATMSGDNGVILTRVPVSIGNLQASLARVGCPRQLKASSVLQPTNQVRCRTGAGAPHQRRDGVGRAHHQRATGHAGWRRRAWRGHFLGQTQALAYATLKRVYSKTIGLPARVSYTVLLYACVYSLCWVAGNPVKLTQ